MAVVETEMQGDVAVIRMNNPPVNALGHALRTGLEKAFAEANADPAVKAIVLTGTGRFFSAGADITEFASGMKEPFLPQLIDKIEASAKPVVAAVNGTALGGGLELALGCHYRVAAKDVRQLGLPEIKLGIIPGAGGTQRLPRAIGVEKALELILSGAFIDAKTGAAAGLIDKIADGDVVAEAVAFAKAADRQAAASHRRSRPSTSRRSAGRAVREGARVDRPSSERAVGAQVRHRRRRAVADAADLRGHPARAPDLPRGRSQPLCAGAAVRLLRRAPGRQPAGHRPRREDAGRGDRRHHRRRDDGDRHHAGLPQRRHPRDAGRDHPGRARCGRRPHQGYALGQRQARAHHRGAGRRPAGQADPGAGDGGASPRPTSSSRRCSRTWR